MIVASEKKSHWWISAILFCGVVAFLFASRSWPYWIDGKLIAASHADEPFHFTAEMVHLSPDNFAKDLTAEAGKNLGEPYESFYRAIGWSVRQTGLSLMQVNMLICWVGNILYLAGLMVLFRKLHLPPWLCALGTLLVAQRFALMGQTPVTHGLAIPREFWIWPLPWFLIWFGFGAREKGWLILFYAVLGIIYTATYPLWAVEFGLAFGLVDLWRIVQGKKWKDLFWLAGGAAICLAVVAIYNVGSFDQMGSGEDSALLERTKHTVALYFTKGFRRFILFAVVGAWAFWELKRKEGVLSEPLRRFQRVWIVSILVCLIYQPFEQPIRALSMLYLGRLSIVAFVISLIAVTVCMHVCFRAFPVWKKYIVSLAIMAVFGFSLSSMNSARPDPQFVRLCWWIKENTPIDTLVVVPPVDRGHFFRIYAERGMWIAPYDKAVLWRTREIYSLQRQRVDALKLFYNPGTSPAEREKILQQMREDGVDYIMTRADSPWTSALSWPVTYVQGSWQLRSSPPGAMRRLGKDARTVIKTANDK